MRFKKILSLMLACAILTVACTTARKYFESDTRKQVERLMVVIDGNFQTIGPLLLEEDYEEAANRADLMVATCNELTTFAPDEDSAVYALLLEGLRQHSELLSKAAREEDSKTALDEYAECDWHCVRCHAQYRHGYRVE